MRKLNWLRKSKRLANAFITTAFLGTQLLAPMSLSGLFNASASADSTGNNGTLKVHEIGTPTGTESNDPKVCAFNFEGFGFDVGQSGYINIDGQGSTHTNYDNAYAFGPTDSNGYAISHDFNNGSGTVTIAAGHYKATLYGKDTGGHIDLSDVKAKSKVFKVDCSAAQPTLTTQVSHSNVTAGDTVSDTATVKGDYSHGSVDGTVDFYLCDPSEVVANVGCPSDAGTAAGTDTVSSRGHATSDTFSISSTTMPGEYCYRAIFNADDSSNYLDAAHTNYSSECFTVVAPAQPTASASVTPCTADTNTNDTVTVSVTNTADNTHNAVTYTVTVDTTSKTLKLNDGASGNVTFTNLAPGSYQATVTGDDGTSTTTSSFTIGTCPYKPAPPTVSIQTQPCTTDSNTTDAVVVSVTNTADNTHNTVTYTVTIGTTSKTVTVADGHTGSVTFTNLPAGGPYSASVTGNDGTGPVTSGTVTVGSCPYIPAKPTVSVTPQLCSVNSGSNDVITVSVTNTADNTHNTVTYTVTIGMTSKTVTVADGHTGSVTFYGLDAGTYHAVVSGNDNTSATSSYFTVHSCPVIYGSISGTKYEVNANGSHVATIAGVQICIDANHNNQCDLGETSTTTDGNGNFSFSNLLAKTYRLIEKIGSGWTQMFGDGNVTVTAGKNTVHDFGNFKNAKISGYKWNDLNGNGRKDWNEPTLKSWEIKLYKVDGSRSQYLATTHTDFWGNYSFSNVAPGWYKVCEEMQNGWVQTYPGNWKDPACHYVDVNLSGHDYSNTNFGNQGRGTITVIKNVDDGFGHVSHDVTYWKWNYQPQFGLQSQTENSGSHNHVNVAAGKYEVKEHQLPGYHVTASSCTDNDHTYGIDNFMSGNYKNHADETQWVDVQPGDNITCTYTNTRDTGTIKVVKNLVPASDSGRFNLKIDGYTKAWNVGDNGTTHDVKVLTGKHSVSETAANESTDMHNYLSSYVCYEGWEWNGGNNDQQPEDVGINTLMNSRHDDWQQPKIVAWGYGTWVDHLNVGRDDHVTCVFTNKRIPQVTIVKQAQPVNEDSSWSFDYTTNANRSGSFTLTDQSSSKTFDHLWAHKQYSFTEADTAGWQMTSLTCDSDNVSINGSTVTVSPNYGDDITCTYVNKELVPVTPGKVTFVQPSCESPTTGHYVIPTTIGVDYLVSVNGSTPVVTPAGTYYVAAGSTVTVSYQAESGYLLGTDPAPAVQTATFTAATNCVLGASTIFGGKGGELANTGQSPWAGIIVALTAITMAIGLAFGTRKSSRA